MKPEELVIAARKKKGFSQTEMADLIAKNLKQSYSARQYQRVESGEFPKYKKEVVELLEDLLDIKIYDKIYHVKESVVEDEQRAYLKQTKNLTTERALINMLILELAKLKSKVYNLSIEDTIDELDKNARLALRQIEADES